MSAYAKLLKAVSEYRGTAANTGIVAATAAMEALVNLAAFRCPCVEVWKLGICVSNSSLTTKCRPPLLNWAYGVSYIAAPAVALFFVSLAANPKLWKLWTGCRNESSNTHKPCFFQAWTLMEIFATGFISPISWVCFGLLDGRYYACAATPLPYDLKTKSTTLSCIDIAAKSSKSLYYGDEFRSNRSFSQVLGWTVIGVLAVVGFIVYSYTQCNFPLTYYHAKYYKIYRENEEAEFDDEMKIKAQHDAECYIRRFMSKRRNKSLWDRISTVFSFHRDKKHLALYSYLHEWVLEDEKREKGECIQEEGHPLVQHQGESQELVEIKGIPQSGDIQIKVEEHKV